MLARMLGNVRKTDLTLKKIENGGKKVRLKNVLFKKVAEVILRNSQEKLYYVNLIVSGLNSNNCPPRAHEIN